MRRSVTAHLLQTRESGLFLLLIAVYLFFAVQSPVFLRAADMLDQSRYWIEIGLLAATMFGVVVAGGIDLSVGSALALSGVAISRLHFEAGLPVWFAAAVGLLLGLLLGAVNGIIIAFARIPDLVVTLATLVIYRGLAQLVAGSRIASGFPASYRAVGESWIVGWVVLGVFWLLMAVFLNRSRPGRYIFAIGASSTAARSAGVPVRSIRVALYALSGMAAALAAVIYTARNDTAKSDDALGLELNVVTCVFLGGTSLRGGRGTLCGVILAVLVVGFLRTGLDLIGSRENTRKIVMGALLVLAVAWNELLAARRSR